MSEQLTFENIALGSTVLTAVLASILKLNPGWKKSKKEEVRSWGTGNSMDLFNGTLPPSVLGLVFLFIMLICPMVSMLVQYTQVELHGSLPDMLMLVKDFTFSLLSDPKASIVATFEWTMSKYGDQIVPAGILVAKWWLLQAALMIFLPGPEHKGPTTENGHVPIYKDNGLKAYWFCVLGLPLAHHMEFIDLAEPYDIFGGLVIVLNVYALVLCMFLYVKGHVNPSGPDSGSLGNAFVDFFWGMELYPRVFDFDLKLFTNCRFGLMAWTILPISYCYKQMDLYGEVSPALLSSTVIQLVYMYKFYLWEMGYMHTMDIQHDRFGYYEGWGCSVWVPIIYTSHSLYFVEHERDVSRELAAFIAICGIYSVFVNYEADWQRQTVRAQDAKQDRACLSLFAVTTKGQENISETGEKVRVIRARYNVVDADTGKTKTKRSILLVDGWWGVVRHFHYVPEILASVCWCLPARSAVPYFYPFYLTLLLIDRALRDDRRCRKKYGKYWDEYCEKVPYLMVPGLF